MTAGKRQQLGNKRLEPRRVLGQQHRAALEQVDLRDEAGALVTIRLYVDDVEMFFAYRLYQAMADGRFLDTN
jgi:hypothetical protein